MQCTDPPEFHSSPSPTITPALTTLDCGVIVNVLLVFKKLYYNILEQTYITRQMEYLNGKIIPVYYISRSVTMKLLEKGPDEIYDRNQQTLAQSQQTMLCCKFTLVIIRQRCFCCNSCLVKSNSE